MSSRYIIYALSDPRTEEPRYIGKSSSGLIRARSHMYPSSLIKKDNPYKNNWLRKLKKLGLKPIIEIVEELPSEENAGDAEKFYIAYFRYLGFRLTNLTEGGEGKGGYTVSEKTKKKISATQGGRPFLDEKGNVYHTKREAADSLYVSPINIGRCLKGMRLSVGGHFFAYVGPDADQKIERDKAAAALLNRPFKDENGTVYRTQQEAASALNVDQANISSCLNGIRLHTGKHSFTYIK